MVITGLERIKTDPSVLGPFLARGDRVALVANPTSCSSDFVPAATILAEACARCGASLVRLFGPEHGLRGEAQAGVDVPDGVDEDTGIPVVSLYGASKRPEGKSFQDIQLLVFDMQDAGLRWYTYLGTLTRIIEALAKNRDEKKPYPALLVLDRPNPLSGAAMEGRGIDAGFESLVGPGNLPARHGMTLGEYARMLGSEFSLNIDAIPMLCWSRAMDMEECGLPWIPPSPNLPTPGSLRAYAGTCLLEGTNVSEGRGTTLPFELFGSPWMDGKRVKEAIDSARVEGLRCRQVFFTPSFSKYSGERCAGVQLYLARGRDSALYPSLASLGPWLVGLLREAYPRDFAVLPPWKEGGKRPLSLLYGNDDLADRLAGGSVPGRGVSDAERLFLEAFAERRKPHLLYGNGGDL